MFIMKTIVLNEQLIGTKISLNLAFLALVSDQKPLQDFHVIQVMYDDLTWEA